MQQQQETKVYTLRGFKCYYCGDTYRYYASSEKEFSHYFFRMKRWCSCPYHIYSKGQISAWSDFDEYFSPHPQFINNNSNE
jgi:hypothetical protein